MKDADGWPLVGCPVACKLAKYRLWIVAVCENKQIRAEELFYQSHMERAFLWVT